MRKWSDVALIGFFAGLTSLFVWFLVQPTLTPADITAQTELARERATTRRAADAAIIARVKHPTNQALPKPNNILSAQDYTWQQLLNRDSIEPIYNPTFVAAAKAGYADDALVIGVAINGEAKAYPIGPLNSREMVNDIVGGIPILVTW